MFQKPEKKPDKIKKAPILHEKSSESASSHQKKKLTIE